MPKRSKNYSDKEKQFIRDNWQDMTDAEMAESIGRKTGGVRSARQKMGLNKFSRHEWTDEQEQILRDLYADTPCEEIMEKIPGVKWEIIRSKAIRMGLRRDENFRREQNRQLGLAQTNNPKMVAQRFDKGHTPFNTGMKQEEYMSEEAIENTKGTRFKAGHEPHNTRWDGAISCRVDSKGNPYMYIRIKKAEWELLHRHNWQKENGPVPEGHILRSVDGNTTNCTPANWELISRGEHANRNRDEEKAVAALMKYRKENGHPAQDLHDSYVAGLMAAGDKELRDYLIEHRQDLIEVARKNYRLMRELKGVRDA